MACPVRRRVRRRWSRGLLYFAVVFETMPPMPRACCTSRTCGFGSIRFRRAYSVFRSLADPAGRCLGDERRACITRRCGYRAGGWRVGDSDGPAASRVGRVVLGREDGYRGRCRWMVLGRRVRRGVWRRAVASWPDHLGERHARSGRRLQPDWDSAAPPYVWYGVWPGRRYACERLGQRPSVPLARPGCSRRRRWHRKAEDTGGLGGEAWNRTGTRLRVG
jgi:hypothetical protein